MDPKDLEEECSDCSHGKCKGPEVGTRLKCWRQSEEGGGNGGNGSGHSWWGRVGLCFKKGIRSHRKVCSREGRDLRQDFKKLLGAAR